jgi:hypothetical protein
MCPQHWSVDDEPAGTSPNDDVGPAEPTPANAAGDPPNDGSSVSPNGETASPRQPPVERAVEIIEALFNLERDLTADLLAVLARCSLDDLSKMFGVEMPAVPTAPEPTPVDVSTMETSGLQGPSWMTPAERSQQQRPDSAQRSWDEQGYRIGPPLPSAFPRQYEPRRRPPGATWLSD